MSSGLCVHTVWARERERGGRSPGRSQSTDGLPGGVLVPALSCPVTSTHQQCPVEPWHCSDTTIKATPSAAMRRTTSRTRRPALPVEGGTARRRHSEARGLRGGRSARGLCGARRESEDAPVHLGRREHVFRSYGETQMCKDLILMNFYKGSVAAVVSGGRGGAPRFDVFLSIMNTTTRGPFGRIKPTWLVTVSGRCAGGSPGPGSLLSLTVHTPAVSTGAEALSQQ
ncbi:hypothetical protein EYF80_024441 [Liparis tanakae]|uniref:Uncharacterized protein n=1 Tax=Liparis tanakae TaxID=230148 RepID=A0A4Z2HHH4_9TELE|nr:hypothetical protein EYF80_024441 [Liparis tanakae]